MEDYKCKQYVTQHYYGDADYSEETFFKLADFRHTHTGRHDLIDLNLFVLGLEGATVLLSASSLAHVQSNCSYEISKFTLLVFVQNHFTFNIFCLFSFTAIGSATSTGCYSGIRNLSSDNFIVLTPSFHILSTLRPLPINVRITKQGEIVVKINGLDKIIVNGTIENPLLINYISFTTRKWPVSKWFFDCKYNIYDSENQQWPPFFSLPWVLFYLFCFLLLTSTVILFTVRMITYRKELSTAVAIGSLETVPK